LVLRSIYRFGCLTYKHPNTSTVFAFIVKRVFAFFVRRFRFLSTVFVLSLPTVQAFCQRRIVELRSG
ncbi:hypothetical protein ABLN72_11490, partial [Mycobacterium tuberculosis]